MQEIVLLYTLENTKYKKKKQMLGPEVGKHFLKKPDNNILDLWSYSLYGKDATAAL